MPERQSSPRSDRKPILTHAAAPWHDERRCCPATACRAVVIVAASRGALGRPDARPTDAAAGPTASSPCTRRRPTRSAPPCATIQSCRRSRTVGVAATRSRCETSDDRWPRRARPAWLAPTPPSAHRRRAGAIVVDSGPYLRTRARPDRRAGRGQSSTNRSGASRRLAMYAWSSSSIAGSRPGSS